MTYFKSHNALQITPGSVRDKTGGKLHGMHVRDGDADNKLSAARRPLVNSAKTSFLLRISNYFILER